MNKNVEKIPRDLIDDFNDYKNYYKKSKKLYSKIDKRIKNDTKDIDINKIFNLEKYKYGYNIYVDIDNIYIFKNNRHNGIHTFRPVYIEDKSWIGTTKLEHIIFLLFKDNKYYNTDSSIKLLIDYIETNNLRVMEEDLFNDFYTLFCVIKPKLKEISDTIESKIFVYYNFYNDVEMEFLNDLSNWNMFLNSIKFLPLDLDYILYKLNKDLEYYSKIYNVGSLRDNYGV